MIISYMIVFLLAAIPFFEIAAIIPIAIIGGMPAIPVMSIAFLGNLLTIILLIIFVDYIIKWRENRKKADPAKQERKQMRAKRIWDKYGLVGLAFLGPFLIGSHLSALLSIVFGGTRNKTLMLMTMSLLTWTLILGGAAFYGFDLLIADDENLGFITRLLNLK